MLPIFQAEINLFNDAFIVQPVKLTFNKRGIMAGGAQYINFIAGGTIILNLGTKHPFRVQTN